MILTWWSLSPLVVKMTTKPVRRWHWKSTWWWRWTKTSPRISWTKIRISSRIHFHQFEFLLNFFRFGFGKSTSTGWGCWFRPIRFWLTGRHFNVKNFLYRGFLIRNTLFSLIHHFSKQSAEGARNLYRGKTVTVTNRGSWFLERFDSLNYFDQSNRFMNDWFHEWLIWLGFDSSSKHISKTQF